MAKVVSQKREIVVRGQEEEKQPSSAVTLLGAVIAALCVAGALAIVVTAFRA